MPPRGTRCSAEASNPTIGWPDRFFGAHMPPCPVPVVCSAAVMRQAMIRGCNTKSLFPL